RHPADWSGVVSLQPTLHPSNERVATVLRQGAAYRVQTPSPPASRPGNAGNRAGTNIPMPVAPGGSAVSEPKRAKVSLSALVFDDAGKHAFGEAKLEIREVRTGDASTIFGVSGDLESLKQAPFQLKRAPGSLFTIGGAETALALARSALGDDALPAGHLGLFDFSAREGEAGPAIDLSLPLALMLEAAMKDQTPGEGIVVAGGVSPEGNLLPKGMVAGLASTVTGFDHEGLLLVPAGAATALRGAIASDNLTVLVKPQIAAAQSIDQARAAVFPPENQKLREAVELFSQVERDDIRAQMTLKDLAANARVQDQLRQVLAAWPDHLSAKLMLEFGTNPSAFQIGIDASVAMVDAALRPVEEYYRSLDSGGVIIGAHEALIDKASTDLRDCRSKVNDAAKGVVSAGERTLDAFKAYLTLTNRSTSIASQRLRELNDAVNAYQTERLKVGISTDPFAH
ncbi:MAG: hypothetical protein KDM91_22345, partial [Verrucomicrobiae bacterium]|nr:hypothetical protein [Verrucomicrobiae bacterium]